MARIVDSIFVDDDRTDQSTELDQRMPVTPIPGEPRCLNGQHGTDRAGADGSQQPLEPGTDNTAT